MIQPTMTRNKPRTERERLAYEEGIADGKYQDNSTFLAILAVMAFFGMVAISSTVEAIFAPKCLVEEVQR